MATFSSVLIPKGAGVTSTLSSDTASSTITLNTYQKFAINATNAITIVFYSSLTAEANQPVPSGTVGFYVPAGLIVTFDLGSSMDSFAIYNLGGTTATYSYQELQSIS